ncbi:hypothetical protein, partial [Kocuria rosea]|uniref:hypothetical protein n=1 Tax=Kocuria rosea TaxID=1275 RepID=UPI003DA0FD80
DLTVAALSSATTSKTTALHHYRGLNYAIARLTTLEASHWGLGRAGVTAVDLQRLVVWLWDVRGSGGR